ncbi:MAG: Holliday junction resolvase RuvX [Gammaproteobacteria bacterium]|nr:Holliday junction resolvase RuvX [Gammaproteobacteria bacterium]
MAEPIKTVIGFDFGTRWIGVAVGQTLTRQASPLGAVKNGDWTGIEKILQAWGPELLIVGLPLNMKGEQQEMSKRAQRFGRQLEGRFGVRAVFVDERLTTREAYQLAIENQSKKSKTEIDSLAAALITESWLRNQENPVNGPPA